MRSSFGLYAGVLSAAIGVGCLEWDSGPQYLSAAPPAPTVNKDRSRDAGRDVGRGDSFVSRVVTSGLYAPWEITWGPDGYLWVTERVGRRVLRINPSDGMRTPLITIADAHQSAQQDGLLGMALHPECLAGTGNDYVYLAYTYDADPGLTLDRRTKIRRYTYVAKTQSLIDPVDIIEGLPASNDHNSGRLAFGPDKRLYYTIGNQGNNQYANTCRTIRAQELPTAEEVSARDWTKYQGKILRLERDGSIPSDNPVLENVRSHVFSYGHRNAQGIAFGRDGILYADEHGPKTDDEVNIIKAGKNYGWPHILGYRDDQAYVYANWSASSPTRCEDLVYSDFVIPESVPIQRESEWHHHDFVPPITTFFTVPNGYNFQDPACAGADYICWPTIAPSSLDVYMPEKGGIPGWNNSLLVTSLKEGAVFRVRLSEDGRSVIGNATREFKTTNRYRDIAVRSDLKTFYVITDNEGLTAASTGGYTDDLENRGAILEFSFTEPR